MEEFHERRQFTQRLFSCFRQKNLSPRILEKNEDELKLEAITEKGNTIGFIIWKYEPKKYSFDVYFNRTVITEKQKLNVKSEWSFSDADLKKIKAAIFSAVNWDTDHVDDLSAYENEQEESFKYGDFNSELLNQMSAVDDILSAIKKDLELISKTDLESDDSIDTDDMLRELYGNNRH
jgi:hypothetical protein